MRNLLSELSGGVKVEGGQAMLCGKRERSATQLGQVKVRVKSGERGSVSVKRRSV